MEVSWVPVRLFMEDNGVPVGFLSELNFLPLFRPRHLEIIFHLIIFCFVRFNIYVALYLICKFFSFNLCSCGHHCRTFFPKWKFISFVGAGANCNIHFRRGMSVSPFLSPYWSSSGSSSSSTYPSPSQSSLPSFDRFSVNESKISIDREVASPSPKLLLPLE